MRAFIVSVSLAASAVAPSAFAQYSPTENRPPVTDAMLEKPSPNDWLMFSRTYDAQRFSPLEEIDRRNVGKLELAWRHEMGTGLQESIPIVYRGLLYAFHAGATIRAYRRRERHGGLGVQAARFLEDQGPRDLRGPRVLHDARRRARRARRGERQGALGNEDRQRGRHVGPHRGRWQGDQRPRLRGQARRLLHRGARRAHGPGGVEIPHGAREGRAGLRELGAGRSRGQQHGVDVGSDGLVRPRAQAHLLGHRGPAAAHAPRAPRRQRRRGAAHVPVGALLELHRRARSRTPASSRGITSICRATTGIRTSRTSAC